MQCLEAVFCAEMWKSVHAMSSGLQHKVFKECYYMYRHIVPKMCIYVTHIDAKMLI